MITKPATWVLAAVGCALLATDAADAQGVLEEVTGQVEELSDRTEVLADRALVYTDDAEKTIHTVTESGLDPETVLARRSTLEDVFLRLTGRTLVD